MILVSFLPCNIHQLPTATIETFKSFSAQGIMG